MQDVRRLGLGEAEILVAGARKHAAVIGVPMCIAVADESGTLMAFVREDGAKVTSVSIAIDKAFTAAGARNHTACYAGIGGGVHVLEGDAVDGGIGLSGGTSGQDHEA